MNQDHAANAYWRGYRNGYNRGQRSGVRKVKAHLKTISLMVYLLCVGSDVQYELLRALMMFNEPAMPDRRRVAIKINGLAMPCFQPLDVVRTQLEDNPFDFVTGEKIYNGAGIEYWGLREAMVGTDDLELKGLFVPMKDICHKFMGWTRGSIKTVECNFHVPTLQMLTWSDGARVKRGTVFGRVRFLDLSQVIIPGVASKLHYWFGYLGKERDIKMMARLRGQDIEYLEEKIWWKGENCFKVEFKFISADNSMLWSEMCISKPYLCALCPLRKGTDAWMTYKSSLERFYITRTLRFQMEERPHYGISAPPAIIRSNEFFFDIDNVSCVVAIMHDLKGTLNHGLQMCNHFARIQFEGRPIERSMLNANREIEERTREILGGSGMVWNRHIRTIFAYFGCIYREVLDHVPILYKLGECGSLLCYLSYQKKITVTPDLHWTRLAVFSVLYETILTFFWEQAKEVSDLKKLPDCSSTYDHGILAHLAEQYYQTGILPIFLSEEDGEASIKNKKKIRTNNAPWDTLQKGLLGEQQVELAQQYVRRSLSNGYRLALQPVSNLPRPVVPNVVVWKCAWEINGTYSMLNLFKDLLDRNPDVISFGQSSDYFIVYCHDGTNKEFEPAFNFCVCGEHCNVILILILQNLKQDLSVMDLTVPATDSD